MYTEDIFSIDWEEMWKSKQEKSDKAKKMHWDNAAEGFERQYSRSDYREKLFDKMVIKPDYSVLDIGCGPGTLAIPLSKLARSITGLDLSPEMLRLGMEKIMAQNIKNISLQQLNWDNVVIGRDLEPHDVVICSRAFHSRSPKKSLLKLNEAANRTVYLTLRASGDEASFFYRNLYKELGKEYVVAPDYIYAYNLLYQAGITACVDFITYTDSFRYDNAQDIFKILSSHMLFENDEQKSKLRQYIERNMAENGEFRMDMKSRWALIWWQKKN